MKSIFVSYSSRHREVTRELVALVEAQYGVGSVWWDHELESRSSFAEQIKAALEEARVVVVIWTAGALISDYVYAEATGAQRRGKLVNVRPADVEFTDIPEPFNIFHVDNLDDHDRVLASIASVMTGTPIATRVPLHELYFRQHGRLLLDPKQSPLPRDPREVSPSQLLQAKFEVVGYMNATGVRQDLIEWCADSPGTAGCLVHGPGGTGKTRLMIDIAKELRQQGWMAGFLEQSPEDVESTQRQRWQALDQLIVHGEDQGLLLIIDYAESRQPEVTQLAIRFAQRRDRETRRIRLVLLGRSAGEWWTTLHDETPEVQRFFRGSDTHPGVIALPIVSAAEGRRALFEASRQAFGPYIAAQGYSLPTREPSLELAQRVESDERYGRPLAVQIEALLWLTSAATTNGSAGVEGLLRQVLGLERTHWTTIVSDLGDDGMRDLSRAVAQLTLIHGTQSRTSTERLLMNDDFYKGQRTARVAVDRDIRRLMRVFGTATDALSPLEPDLIGEHHVATIADVEMIDGCIRWIQTEPTDQQDRRHRSLMTVLQRATRAEHGDRATARVAALLDYLIDMYSSTLSNVMVTVMIETPGSLTERMEQRISGLAGDALKSIANALPAEMPSLMDLSVSVATRLVEVARERDPADERLLADCLYNLSIRLANVDRQEEALGVASEAISRYRRLREGDAEVLPQLARALVNLSEVYSQLEKPFDALRAALDAFHIYRDLPDPQPDAVHIDVAATAGRLAICMGNAGKDEDAVFGFEESVRLYRELAENHPDLVLDLATSLNNVAVSLSRVDRDQEALAASQEAVDIYRRVAKSRPDPVLPHLAAALDTLGNRLSKVTRVQEALAAGQEAVAIFRRLEEIRPDAFLAGLEKGLLNCCQHLANLDRLDEALSANQEGIAICRRLAERRPDAFGPRLATAVLARAQILEAQDQLDDGMNCVEDAIRTLTPFFLSQPELLEDQMRSLLREHRRFLDALGREPDEGLLGDVVEQLYALQQRGTTE